MKVYILAFAVIVLAGLLDLVHTFKGPKDMRGVMPCIDDADCQRMCDQDCGWNEMLGRCAHDDYYGTTACWCEVL